MVKAVWNSKVIAESEQTVLIEGNHYFPRNAVSSEYLVESKTKSTCPWKGTASYFSLLVDGKRNEDAVWYYPDPLSAAAEIKDHVAFWGGVEVN